MVLVGIFIFVKFLMWMVCFMFFIFRVVFFNIKFNLSKLIVNVYVVIMILNGCVLFMFFFLM